MKQATEEQIPIVDYRNITIRVDNLQISLRVDRTEEAEEVMRNAAKRVNHLLSIYMQKYPQATTKELLIYIALHLAHILEEGELKHKQAEVEERLKRILNELNSVEL